MQEQIKVVSQSADWQQQTKPHVYAETPDEYSSEASERA